MTPDLRKPEKSCKRVPFLTHAGLGVNRSETQFYDQISLPLKNGTILAGWFSSLRKTNGRRTKRAAFCSFSRASLTIEAAYALPIMILVTICIISMINVYGKVLERTAALRDTAMTAALVSTSSEEEKRIQIDLPVLFKPYYLPEGISPVPVPCRACVRAWNGRDEFTEAEGKDSTGEYVYITENQSVYHTSADCTHLDLSIKSVSEKSVPKMKNEYGSRYHVCDKCGTAGTDGIVYITSYGDCYHTSSECSALKRTVRLVSKTEVDQQICQCSRCAAKSA